MKYLPLIGLLLLAGGCRKREDAPAANIPHVAGAWSGTGSDDAVGYFDLSVDITQSGNSAAGTFTMTGPGASQSGDVSLVLGPQGGNNLQSLGLTRKSWTVADPANANRVCMATMSVKANTTFITNTAVSFRYTMSDCQGGVWTGGANLHKIAGTN